MAFASSTFLGTTTATKPTQLRQTRAPCPTGVRMVSKPPGRSKIWEEYSSKMKAGSERQPFASSKAAPRSASESAIRIATTPFFMEYAKAQMRGFGSGGDARAAMLRPYTRIADDYISACCRKQYIAASNGSGVYGPQCTEGGSKFAAEDARIAGLAFEYRAKQVPTNLSFADIFESRRRAIVLAQGCNYEEGLVSKFVGAASSIVTGTSEKSRACNRYTSPTSLAEKYMTECVSRAASARSTSGGVYGVQCCDGTVKGAAEAKRVTALAVQFRNGQRSLFEKEASKFELARYARENYANMCSYEEELYGKFPATAAAMRPDFMRY